MKLTLDNNCVIMNRLCIGEIHKEVDGYYVFTFARRPGAWTSNNLKEIADFLDNLNAEWDAEVQAHFNIQTHGA